MKNWQEAILCRNKKRDLKIFLDGLSNATGVCRNVSAKLTYSELTASAKANSIEIQDFIEQSTNCILIVRIRKSQQKCYIRFIDGNLHSVDPSLPESVHDLYKKWYGPEQLEFDFNSDHEPFLIKFQ